MFEVVGLVAVWVIGLVCSASVPVYVGMLISDYRRDDGLAAFQSIPIGVATAITYLLASAVIFVNAI